MTAANCVGAPPGRGQAIRRYFRSRASRDRNLLAAPDHRLGQAQGVEHPKPECGTIAGTPEIGESTRQQETKVSIPLLQPSVPTPKRASGTSGRRGWPGPRERQGQARRATRFAGATSCTSAVARYIPAGASRCGDRQHSKSAGPEPGCGSLLPGCTDPPYGNSSRAPRAPWCHSAGRHVADRHQASGVGFVRADRGW